MAGEAAHRIGFFPCCCSALVWKRQTPVLFPVKASLDPGYLRGFLHLSKPAGWTHSGDAPEYVHCGLGFEMRLVAFCTSKVLCQRFLNHMVRGIVQMEKSICQENLAHNLLQRSSHRELAEYNVACFLAETTLKSTPCRSLRAVRLRGKARCCSGLPCWPRCLAG